MTAPPCEPLSPHAQAFLPRSPIEAQLNFLSQMHDRTRGVEVHGFQQATESVALLKGRRTGSWEALAVQVEPEAPHRITWLSTQTPKPPAGAQPKAPRSDTERVRALEAHLRTLADADVFSGAVLFANDGEVLFHAAYGEANKDVGVPNRVDTNFKLGSMNKMFTAVAIAQLAERGLLSFNDPLSKFLPGFPDPETAQKIRIEHLLTHTSGLGSYFSQEFMQSSRARWRTVHDMMQLAEGDSLAFDPGTRWGYSNAGFLVLGKGIETVTGQSYYDYVRENICKPFGMADTDSYELDRVNPNLGVGYQEEFSDEDVSFRNNVFQHVIRGGPAGSGYSTAGDLLRFAEALRSHRLVGPAFTEQLWTPRPDLGSPAYGYGLGIGTEPRSAGHSGGFSGISSNLSVLLSYPGELRAASCGSPSRPTLLLGWRRWQRPECRVFFNSLSRAEPARESLRGTPSTLKSCPARKSFSS